MTTGANCRTRRRGNNEHLVVKNLGLAAGGLRDQVLVENIEDVLADSLELLLDLDAVVADRTHVLLGALGLLLLLDGGDDSPRGPAGADDVLVGDAEEVALVDGQLEAHLRDLLHVGDHLIVALGLLAQASEESLAVGKGQQLDESMEGFLVGEREVRSTDLSRCGKQDTLAKARPSVA